MLGYKPDSSVVREPTILDEPSGDLIPNSDWMYINYVADNAVTPVKD